MAKKHINIPIFIPHLGCPNQCVFCNQRTISGVVDFDRSTVSAIIEDALLTKPDGASAEIAFFGGSFTGIDRDLMKDLLEVANGYLIQGRIDSIRCSTRPDYIDEEVLDIIKSYGVGTVELGLQSSSEEVLAAAKRGHGFDSERMACELIKKKGLRLGGQMMIGLPMSSRASDLATARFIAEVGCDEARIYPTLVFKDTELAQMLDCGAYTSIGLDEAIERSTDAFEILIDSGVKILRIGLCDSENLHSEDTYLAGPNHPAIGELTVGEYYYRKIKRLLEEVKEDRFDTVKITVPIGHTSKVIGHNKKNKIRLMQEYGIRELRVIESYDLSEYSVLLCAEGRK